MKPVLTITVALKREELKQLVSAWGGEGLQGYGIDKDYFRHWIMQSYSSWVKNLHNKSHFEKLQIIIISSIQDNEAMSLLGNKASALILKSSAISISDRVAVIFK